MKKYLLLFMVTIFLVFVPKETNAAENQLIIINKSNNQLAFFDDGELVRTFPVGTGRSKELTPEGTFPIVNKIKNRPYYSEGIPGGSPLNPLGDRWLGLNALETNGTTYAIHGNNNPNSIGKYVSAGCVRMHNEDVRWLFDRVETGTNVVILTSSKSFNDIAIEKGHRPTPPVKVILDGKEIKTSENAFLENGRVLVPMRSIFQELGATVRWEAATSSITATKKSDTVQLKIGSKQAMVNGRSSVLEVAPKIYQSVTFVPTRFVSESLRINVKWDSSNRTVILTTPKAPSKTSVSVSVNSNKLTETGYLTEGKSFIPVSGVFTSLGASVSFNGTTSTLTVTNEGNVLVLKTNSKQATLNGQSITLSAESKIDKGRFYAPTASVIQALNGTAMFDSKTNTVKITLQ